MAAICTEPSTGVRSPARPRAQAPRRARKPRALPGVCQAAWPVRPFRAQRRPVGTDVQPCLPKPRIVAMIPEGCRQRCRHRACPARPPTCGLWRPACLSSHATPQHRKCEATRCARSGAGGPQRCGWRIDASTSTPSTTRGPGRTMKASASTALTSARGVSRSALLGVGAWEAAPSRPNPHGDNTTTSASVPPTASQVTATDGAPAWVSTGVPPAAVTRSGT